MLPAASAPFRAASERPKCQRRGAPPFRPITSSRQPEPPVPRASPPSDGTAVSRRPRSRSDARNPPAYGGAIPLSIRSRARAFAVARAMSLCSPRPSRTAAKRKWQRPPRTRNLRPEIGTSESVRYVKKRPVTTRRTSNSSGSFGFRMTTFENPISVGPPGRLRRSDDADACCSLHLEPSAPGMRGVPGTRNRAPCQIRSREGLRTVPWDGRHLCSVSCLNPDCARA